MQRHQPRFLKGRLSPPGLAGASNAVVTALLMRAECKRGNGSVAGSSAKFRRLSTQWPGHALEATATGGVPNSMTAHPRRCRAVPVPAGFECVFWAAVPVRVGRHPASLRRPLGRRAVLNVASGGRSERSRGVRGCRLLHRRQEQTPDGDMKRRVGEQRTADPPTLKTLVDRKAADECRGQR